MSGSRGRYPDSGELLVAGIEGTLEAALEDVLVLDHRLDLILTAPPVECLYERSEWLHGNDGYLSNRAGPPPIPGDSIRASPLPSATESLRLCNAGPSQTFRQTWQRDQSAAALLTWAFPA